MPTYDYECRTCGNRVEVLHGVNDTGPAACERCGGPMRKLMSTPSIVFKGSGWAKKDARDARPAARAGAAAGKSETTQSSGNSSGESSRGGSSESSAKVKDDSGGSTGPKESSAGAASAD